MTEAEFEARFGDWLRLEAGVDEPRRVVRRGPGAILVSKFDEGFAGRLLETIAALPEVFEDAVVGRAYDIVAIEMPGATRVSCWHEAVRRILASAVDAGRLTADERAAVLAGVDSVAALLDSVLWTGPIVGGEFSPAQGEVDAYREARARMDLTNGLFTRFYGTFEGLPVVNHCPGAQLARRLTAQAWTLCTGLPPGP
ncbi:MAG: hypothetical protein C0506_12490 [Anaerolinea sp.]|nr:hypothetical protein [Anaerolinea sp.]